MPPASGAVCYSGVHETGQGENGTGSAMRSWAVWVVGSSLVLCVAGCSEKKEPPPELPVVVDQCLGASDMQFILASRMDGGTPAPAGDGGTSDGGVDAGAPIGDVVNPLVVALECGAVPDCLDPLLAGDVDAGYACVEACIEASPAVVLSMECRYCYIVNGLFCAGALCLVECLGTDRDVCAACMAEKCDAALYDCIGF